MVKIISHCNGIQHNTVEQKCNNAFVFSVVFIPFSRWCHLPADLSIAVDKVLETDTMSAFVRVALLVIQALLLVPFSRVSKFKMATVIRSLDLAVCQQLCGRENVPRFSSLVLVNFFISHYIYFLSPFFQIKPIVS